MSEAKHTPGPWTCIEDHYSDSAVVVDAGGFQHVEANSPVAVLLDYADKLGIPHWADSPAASREIGLEEQTANARLIAAAPDLLEALQSFIFEFGDKTNSATVNKARAAIRKATGA